jgi:hypothetical protein
MADENMRFGYRDIEGHGRVYYEVVDPEQVSDPLERQHASDLKTGGYVLMHVFSAGEDMALGALAPGVLTPLSEAEFVAARDAGWPNGPFGGATYSLHVGGSMSVTPSLNPDE